MMFLKDTQYVLFLVLHFMKMHSVILKKSTLMEEKYI